MDVIALLKQTFDTEVPIALADGTIREDGAKYVINPYDEYAVEEAIRIREAQGGTVTVVSVGPQRAEDALRTALAMGADRAVLADDPALFGDPWTTSEVLAAIVRSLGFDLILAGNQTVDGGSGQVAVRVAEILGIAHIASVTKLSVDGGRVMAHRDAGGDDELVEATLPVLVTAQQGLNEPRYPSLIGIRKARQKPLARVTLAELGLEPAEIAPKTRVLRTFLPRPRPEGRILTGDISEQIRELATALHTLEKVV